MCSPVHLSVDLRVVPASRLFPVQPPAPFTSESVWTLALVSRGGRPVRPPARTAAPCVTVREAAQPFPVATPPHVQQHCPRGPVPPRRCHAGCGRASAGPASATSWLWPGPPRRTPVPTASRAGAHCVSAGAGRVSGPCPRSRTFCECRVKLLKAVVGRVVGRGVRDFPMPSESRLT